MVSSRYNIGDFAKTTDTFTSANNVFATFLIISIYFANVLPKHRKRPKLRDAAV